MRQKASDSLPFTWKVTWLQFRHIFCMKHNIATPTVLFTRPSHMGICTVLSDIRIFGKQKCDLDIPTYRLIYFALNDKGGSCKNHLSVSLSVSCHIRVCSCLGKGVHKEYQCLVWHSLYIFSTNKITKIIKTHGVLLHKEIRPLWY